MKVSNLILLAVASAVLVACGGSDDGCDTLMDDVRAKNGAPEESRVYNSSTYYSESWDYWTKGVIYTFSQYKNDSCKVSTYRFTPIR